MGITVFLLLIGGLWLKYAFLERDKCQAQAKTQKNSLVKKYLEKQASLRNATNDRKFHFRRFTIALSRMDLDDSRLSK